MTLVPDGGVSCVDGGCGSGSGVDVDAIGVGTPPASLPPPHDAVSGDVDVEWGERDAGLCHRRVTLSRNVCTEATPRDADDAAAVDVDAEASPPRNRCTSSGDRASPPRVDVYTESTESSLR